MKDFILVYIIGIVKFTKNMAVLLRKVIAYGTNQGTSKEIAEKIGKETGIDVVAVQDIKVEDLNLYSTIIFVVPTYGRGAPPDSVKPWWDTFSASSTSLSTVHFAVFGLGSSNFRRSFVGFAKALEKKMLDLGAKEITEMGVLDDNDDKSTDMNQFIEAVKNFKVA